VAKGTCSECGAPAVNRGRCNKHYREGLRTGELDLVHPRRSVPPVERFWSKVEKTGPLSPHVPGRCWQWLAEIAPNGYGKFYSGSGTLAHRFAYELLKGPIPGELQIDHLCRNRACATRCTWSP
jgi:hypothetical protein